MTEPEDFESPYFDWENDCLFDAKTRDLIDRIAQDPRFTRGYEGRVVADDLASHLPEARRRSIGQAAFNVFDSTGREGSRSRSVENPPTRTR